MVNLKLIAVDFPFHRELSFLNNIMFFQENDKLTFIDAIKKSKTLNPLKDFELDKLVFILQVKKIIKFFK